MKTVKYSIIIPAYNAESTIKRCIDSAVSQDYDNYEVIVIDDGSTDKTSSILDEYSKRGITIKKQENGGVSAARNHGLKLARGEWVLFLDADDWLDKQALKHIDATLSGRNIDLIVTRLISPNENLSDIPDRSFSQSNVLPLVDRLIFMEGKNDGNDRYPSIFNLRCIGGKIIRSSLIKQNGISFPECVSSFEDGIFILKCLFSSQKTLCSSLSFYNYFSDNPSSRTNTERTNAAEEDIYVFDTLSVILKDNSYSTPAMNDLAFILFISSINSILCFDNKKIMKQHISNLYRHFKKNINKASPRHFRFTKRIELTLTRHHLLCVLILALKAKHFFRRHNL